MSRSLLPAYLCAILVASGCTRGDEQAGAPARATASAERFQPTSELLLEPELARRVDALAATKRFEYTEVYRYFLEGIKTATRAELRALLRHESPVVRGYVGEYVADNEVALLRDVGPLLRDETEVESVSDGRVSGGTVASFVLTAVCYSDLPGAKDLILDVIAQDGVRAPRALGCLPRYRDGSLSQTVEWILANRSRPAALRDEALRLFTIAPVQAQCARMRAFASNVGAPSRSLYVAALAQCEDRDSFVLLEDLAKTARGTILTEAKVALLLHPWTPDARRRELAQEQVVRDAAPPGEADWVLRGRDSEGDQHLKSL